MLHHTTFSNGYEPCPSSRSRAIFCAIWTISPRTAYSEFMTRVLMLSIDSGALRVGLGDSVTVVTGAGTLCECTQAGAAQSSHARVGSPPPAPAMALA